MGYNSHRSHSARTVRQYRLLSRIYDITVSVPWFERPRMREFALANIQPGQRVVLIGVGTGLDLPYLKPGTIAIGIDVSREMIVRARAKGWPPGATFALMDAEALGFTDQSVDVVIMNLVLSIIGDPRRSLSEATRVIKPGAHIWLLHKDAKPSQNRLLRRLLSWITTSIGGADLTRSIDHLIVGLPLTKHVEERGRVADVIGLTRCSS